MKITLIGLAGKVSHPENLENFNGISCQDNFADYSDIEKLIYGFLRFELIDGKLYSVIEYSVDGELTEEEIQILKEETSGQLSDGIGEGFEQYPCCEIDGEDAYISPWFSGQELKIR